MSSQMDHRHRIITSAISLLYPLLHRHWNLPLRENRRFIGISYDAIFSLKGLFAMVIAMKQWQWRWDDGIANSATSFVITIAPACYDHYNRNPVSLRVIFWLYDGHRLINTRKKLPSRALGVCCSVITIVGYINFFVGPPLSQITMLIAMIASSQIEPSCNHYRS